jgi:hypothetical protein
MGAYKPQLSVLALAVSFSSGYTAMRNASDLTHRKYYFNK